MLLPGILQKTIHSLRYSSGQAVHAIDPTEHTKPFPSQDGWREPLLKQKFVEQDLYIEASICVTKWMENVNCANGFYNRNQFFSGCFGGRNFPVIPKEDFIEQYLSLPLAIVHIKLLIIPSNKKCD